MQGGTKLKCNGQGQLAKPQNLPELSQRFATRNDGPYRRRLAPLFASNTLPSERKRAYNRRLAVCRYFCIMYGNKWPFRAGLGSNPK